MEKDDLLLRCVAVGKVKEGLEFGGEFFHCGN